MDNDLLPPVPEAVEKEEDVRESPDCTSSEESDSEEEAVPRPVTPQKKGPKQNKFKNDRPTVAEAAEVPWFEILNQRQRQDAYRQLCEQRVKTSRRRDAWIPVVTSMPNNFTAYDTYQRLRGPERPVTNLLRKADLKRTLKPTPYLTETRTFYKFGATVKSNGAKFLYLVH